MNSPNISKYSGYRMGSNTTASSLSMLLTRRPNQWRTIAAPGPHDSLTLIVPRRTPISLSPPPHPSLPPLFFFFILFSVSLQPFAANLALTPILWLVGFGAATAQSFGLTPHLQRHCAFTVRVWSERLVAEAANKSKGWESVCVCVCACVCNRMGSCGSASVCQRPRQSVSLCPGKLSESPLRCRFLWIIGLHHLQEVNRHSKESSPGFVTLWPHFKAGEPHAAEPLL